MNEFAKALAVALGPEGLNKVQRVKIGIAGTGGLGSNCAQFLVRSGFRKFRLVDFDRVEYSNLNRQFFFNRQVGQPKVEALKQNLLEINKDIEVEVLPAKIEAYNVAELFADCDAVIEALDRPEYKKLVVEAYLNSGKLLVAASGLAGYGKTDGITIHKIKDKFLSLVTWCQRSQRTALRWPRG